MIAITHAKMGRSMKKRAMARNAYLLPRGGGPLSGRAAGRATVSPPVRRPRSAVHGHAGLDLLQAFDDHPVAGLQALLHQPLVADGCG